MSEERISRRRLIGAGVTIAALGAGAWRLRVPEQPSPSEGSKPAQTAEEEAGRRFGEEYEAMRTIIQAGFPFLIIPRQTIDDFLQAVSQAKRRPRRADQVKELFLLSTDFFAHGADEARPLSFARLYDPYLNPCYNPMEPA